MAKSRTENSVKNIKTGLIVQIVNKVLAFVVRTVFIHFLNSDYLGVNGLFTNILSILSFAELGIGTAIIFNMYKPIAENDKEKIKSLMQLYKKSYTVIGIFIFAAGLLIIPFMDYLITDVPNIKENIIFIYILFLFDTSCSYFFTYKKSIITAYQKQSIINNFDSIFYLLKSILQIILLILTHNYIFYLITQIICTIVENILISIKADKMYPFLKDKNIKKLSKKETSTIFDNVKSLAIYQFGSVIMNGTDNIMISALINVKTVGIVSNYTLIITSLKSVLTSGLNGITASVGNLNATAKPEKKEDIFYQLLLAYYLIYSFCAIALILLLNNFINIWIGNKYILSMSVAVALAISFFIEGIRNPAFIYRTTLGLFEKSKATPYIGAISNIILSIIFCKLWGLPGIFIGTSVAQLISYFWIDPYLIHRYEFKTPVKKFFAKATKYFLAFTFELIICMLISSLIPAENILSLVYRLLIVLLIPNILNILLFFKSEEFKSLYNRFVGKKFKLKKA